MRYRSPAKNTRKTSELPEKITTYLKENPGSRLYSIVNAIGASRGAVTYQLRNMIYQEQVFAGGSGASKCYYLKCDRYSKEQILLHEFRKNQTKNQIITQLINTPKLTREELSEVLNIKEGTIYRHLVSLEKAGILKRKRDGHSLRYEVSEKTLLTLRTEK